MGKRESCFSSCQAECFERLADAPGRRKRSATDEVPRFRVLSREDFAKRALASGCSADVAALRDKWLADGLASATVVRLLALLSHVFSTARRELGMESLSNPVELVSKPRWLMPVLGGSSLRVRQIPMPTAIRMRTRAKTRMTRVVAR